MPSRVPSAPIQGGNAVQKVPRKLILFDDQPHLQLLYLLLPASADACIQDAGA